MATKGSSNRSRHCFRSAYIHLRKAHLIADVDPAMAAFRALTAEEEAASGLMYCLKERGYEMADLLRPTDHRWKNGVIPFISALGLFFHEIFGDRVQAKVLFQPAQDDEPEHLGLGIPMVVDGEEVLLRPLPPLNFLASVNGELPPSYLAQLEKVASSSGRENIRRYIAEEANTRNRLLYASATGVPEVTSIGEDFYRKRRRNVLVLLGAYLFIQPYQEIQPFVQASLKAFVQMMGQEVDGLHPTV